MTAPAATPTPATSGNATAAGTPPLAATHAIPCLAYADAPAALRWLVAVLGAELRQQHPGPDGTVAHAELWFGTACVMLGSRKDDARMPEGVGRATVYVVLATRDAVDALHTRVAAAGGRITQALTDTDYGSRDFICRDPEGNAWCFGTYAP